MPPKKGGGPSDVDRVWEFLSTKNRPYSVQMLVDSFKNEIKKTAMVKSLEKLTSDGRVVLKEWGKSKIYFANQEGFEKLSTEEIDELDKDIITKTEELKTLREKLSGYQKESSALSVQLTDDQIEEKLKELNAEIKTYEEKIEGLQSGRVQITPADIATANAEREKYMKAWKQRKGWVMEIVSAMSEGSGKRPRELFETIGIETDEECSVSFTDSLVAQLEKKQKTK